MPNPKNLKPGEEQYEEIFLAPASKRKSIQYNYRHRDGELFSMVAPDLEEARFERLKWLAEKGE